MLPKSGNRLPKRAYSESEIAAIIGHALVEQLGGSRRATKTVMKWADVSDRSARAWVNGETCPSCRHLILLASQSPFVMAALLNLMGHEQIAVGIDLREVEQQLELITERVRKLREATVINSIDILP